MKTSRWTWPGQTQKPVVMWMACLSILTACQPQSVKPDPNLVYQQEQARIAREQAAAERRLEALLMRAEWALGRDRLTTPARDSAYGLFQEVLRLQPGNDQALSGLQQVAIRYIQLARTAVAHGKLTKASGYAAQARRIDPSNPLLVEFEKMYQVALEAEKAAVSGNELLLDSEALSRRDENLLPLLGEVAERIKASDETIVIIARNDAEGRWLYQQMRKAAEGYRIRGDIQVGAVPKIVVYPPIQ